MSTDEFEQQVRAGLATAVEHLDAPPGLRNAAQRRMRERARRRLALRAGCVGAAGVLTVAGLAWTHRTPGGRGSVVTVAPTPRVASSGAPATTGPEPGTTTASTAAPTGAAAPSSAAAPPSPPALAASENILVLGLDDQACTDPGPPSGGGTDGAGAAGVRADTIMVLHVDPATPAASLLSFPPDLWVTAPGRGMLRLGAAAQLGRYDLMAQTLDDNFGIRVDHYVQVDFCAFTTLVDAVGGLRIPVPRAIRDADVGLAVPAGCHTFGGDEALAYVRAVHLEVQETDGTWRGDPTGDLGRSARQQDLVARLLTTVMQRGLLDPGVARGLLTALQDSVVIDAGLTFDDMIGIGRLLDAVGPAHIAMHQIPTEAATVAGSAVLIPQLDDPGTDAMLDVFRARSPASTGTAPTGTASSAAGSAAGTSTVDPRTILPSTVATC